MDTALREVGRATDGEKARDVGGRGNRIVLWEVQETANIAETEFIHPLRAERACPVGGMVLAPDRLGTCKEISECKIASNIRSETLIKLQTIANRVLGRQHVIDTRGAVPKVERVRQGNLDLADRDRDTVD